MGLPEECKNCEFQGFGLVSIEYGATKNKAFVCHGNAEPGVPIFTNKTNVVKGCSLKSLRDDVIEVTIGGALVTPLKKGISVHGVGKG